MNAEKDIQQAREARETWFASPQGAYAREAGLRLTKQMISPWPKRGHNALQLGFDHVHSVETLWENGFDVSAVASQAHHVPPLPAALRDKIPLHHAAFDHLPFEDKSFDYVLVRFVPRKEAYPPLPAVLKEALRVAAKGVMYQGWNPCSWTGLQYRCQKNSLPLYLQQSYWHSWRDIYNTFRTLAPDASLSSGSLLTGPLPSWHAQSYFLRLNSAIIPYPVGAFMHVRATFVDQTPLTGTPLEADPITRSNLHANPLAERVQHGQRTQRKKLSHPRP